MKMVCWGSSRMVVGGVVVQLMLGVGGGGGENGGIRMLGDGCWGGVGVGGMMVVFERDGVGVESVGEMGGGVVGGWMRGWRCGG